MCGLVLGRLARGFKRGHEPLDPLRSSCDLPLTHSHLGPELGHHVVKVGVRGFSVFLPLEGKGKHR